MPALFVTERPRFTDGLIRDLEEMVQSGAPGWENTALGTILGIEKDDDLQEQTVVEAVPLNEEQRQAVRKAVNSPLTAVTGPPGTGKSQVVVSMVADAYVRGRRVLFTSKNRKAVNVVENRVAAFAANPGDDSYGQPISNATWRTPFGDAGVKPIRSRPRRIRPTQRPLQGPGPSGERTMVGIANNQRRLLPAACP